MATIYNYTDIDLDSYRPIALERKASGWRYVQTMCTNTSDGFDLTVTFCKDGIMDNFRIRSLSKSTVVPSISDLFFSAFVFENEAHDLFGITIKDIVIDFKGKFYDLSVKEPMAVVTTKKKPSKVKSDADAGKASGKITGKTAGNVGKTPGKNADKTLHNVDDKKVSVKIEEKTTSENKPRETAEKKSNSAVIDSKSDNDGKGE